MFIKTLKALFDKNIFYWRVVSAVSLFCAIYLVWFYGIADNYLEVSVLEGNIADQSADHFSRNQSVFSISEQGDELHLILERESIDLSSYDEMSISVESAESYIVHTVIKTISDEQEAVHQYFHEQIAFNDIGEITVPFHQLRAGYSERDKQPSQTFDAVQTVTVLFMPLSADKALARPSVSHIFFEKRLPLFLYFFMLVLLVLVAFRKKITGEQEEVVVVEDENEQNYSNYKRIRTVLMDLYAEPLTVEIVANKTDIPYYMVSKTIKENTGLSFNQYLNKIRIGIAKEKLVTTETQVSEIAWDVGFKNVTHFNRVFKEYEKTTPLKFRKDSVLTADSVKKGKERNNG